MNYDVIGDIHGQLGKLVSLLSLLGYAESGGLFRHPSRTAIFVGDLIDRGPQQLATVDLVQRMVQAGSARCVLGLGKPQGYYDNARWSRRRSRMPYSACSLRVPSIRLEVLMTAAPAARPRQFEGLQE